jgi:hypothetical protein
MRSRSSPPRGPDGFPEEGIRCERCGTRVPVFATLGAADERRVRELAAAGDSVAAMHELRRSTGCSERWAKIWVVHAVPQPEPDAVPCGWCGARLRSPAARQCLQCGMDWHDAANPRRLGG